MKAVEYLFVVKFSIALGSWTRGGDGVARPRWRPLLEEQGGVMYDATIYFNHEVMSIVRRCALTDCFQLARLVDSYCKTLNLCMRQAEVFSLGNTGPSIRGYEVNVKVLTELRDRLASARRGNAEMDRNVASYTEMVLNIADKRLSEI
jgi:hypothetical protein